MARFAAPATVVILCPIPRGITAVTAAEWVRRGRDAGVAVTWVAAPETLPVLRDAMSASSTTDLAVAVDLAPVWPCSRQSLRAMLTEARSVWPGLTSAVLRGAAPLDHRDVLVQEGIATVCVDGFDDTPRGSRRPAPRGWPCRSILWGLWEVNGSQNGRGGMASRLASWCGGRRIASGLTVLHAGGPAADIAPQALRCRLEKHVAWVRRRMQSGAVDAVALPDVPALIAGGGNAMPRGSVLRAA